MKRIVLLAVLFAMPWARGDTVHFKNGTSVDGTVSYPDANTVVLGFGSGGSMTFQASDVKSVEKNDKTGDTTKLMEYKAKVHNDSIDKRTGMNDKQRQEVNELLEPMRQDDEGVRNTARRKLVAIGREMPVFQYIETILPYSKGRLVPEMMQTLVDLDASKGKEVVRWYTMNPDPAVRAKAVELIAASRNPDDIQGIAGGMMDPDPDVRARTANALANAGSKAATHVLIEGLKSTDLRTQNASRTALKQLWEEEGQVDKLNTAEQWDQFWKSQSRKVKDAINPEELQPLITKEQLENATVSHDE